MNEKLKKQPIEKAVKSFAEMIKKRKSDINNLISNDNYILWLEKFTEKYPSFTDEDWLYKEKEISQEDNKNVVNLGLLFDAIEEYARNNFIYPQNNIESYNIEHNNIGYRIGLINGQGGFFFCVRTTPTSDFISLLDIRENVEQPNVQNIKERLEFLKGYLRKMVEENIPVEAIKETTQKVLQKKY